MKKTDDMRFIADIKMAHAAIGPEILVLGIRKILNKENKNRIKDNEGEGYLPDRPRI